MKLMEVNITLVVMLLCNVISILGNIEIADQIETDSITDSTTSTNSLEQLVAHHNNKVSVKCIAANTCGAGQYSSNSNGCAGCTDCPAGKYHHLIRIS